MTEKFRISSVLPLCLSADGSLVGELRRVSAGDPPPPASKNPDYAGQVIDEREYHELLSAVDRANRHPEQLTPTDHALLARHAALLIAPKFKGGQTTVRRQPVFRPALAGQNWGRP